MDFGNLGGGNYRVTMTTTGQLNFRYVVDGQTYDSNPEVAILDLTATTTQPLGYLTLSTTYTGTATIRLPNAGPGDQPVYTSTFDFTTSTLPGLFFTDLNIDSGGSSSGGTQFNFQSDSLGATGYVDGRTFNFAPLSSPTVYVAPNSIVAQVMTPNGDFYNNFGLGALAAEDNPEPGTFVLIGGALLSGVALRRRFARP